MHVRGLVTTIAVLLAPIFAAPAAVSAEVSSVRIGVLTDMTSSYADYGGAGSVLAAKLAVSDAGMAGRVEVMSADTLNKADNAAATARQWFDQGTDAIFDVPTSSVALAVNFEAGRAKKLVFFSTTIADRITEEDCNGYGLAWVWDTYSVGRAEALALLKAGRDTVFIITPDGAAGVALEQTARRTIEGNGGKVLGAVRHPVNVPDWSSYLVQAQSSGAKAVLFGSGGSDLVGGLKAAREFGLPQSGIAIGTMYGIITDVHAVGLDVMQGLSVVSAFYWDRDDETRAFARRFFERHGKMPTEFQAGVYSSVLQYLRAIQAVGSKDADAVRAHLLKASMKDAFLRNATLLPNGRLLTDMMLMRIKSPDESTKPWDYFAVTGTVPGAEAFRTLSESRCPIKN